MREKQLSKGNEDVDCGAGAGNGGGRVDVVSVSWSRSWIWSVLKHSWKSQMEGGNLSVDSQGSKGRTGSADVMKRDEDLKDLEKILPRKLRIRSF